MVDESFDGVINELVKGLADGIIPGHPESETEFDRDFVAPVCERIIMAKAPEWDLAIHPWGDREKAAKWRASKEWGAISTWGMHHTLDLVARESPSGKKLGIEIKLAKVRGNRAPTADFQRMVGQCLIGRLAHDTVIGVFGVLPVDEKAKECVGRIVREFRNDAKGYRLKLGVREIQLVVRQVDALPQA